MACPATLRGELCEEVLAPDSSGSLTGVYAALGILFLLVVLVVVGFVIKEVRSRASKKSPDTSPNGHHAGSSAGFENMAMSEEPSDKITMHSSTTKSTMPTSDYEPVHVSEKSANVSKSALPALPITTSKPARSKPKPTHVPKPVRAPKPTTKVSSPAPNEGEYEYSRPDNSESTPSAHATGAMYMNTGNEQQDRNYDVIDLHDIDTRPKIYDRLNHNM